ncbi:MAG: hypothetical protein ABIC68_07540 [Candidatus Omnitrophota bacterium]
MKKMFLLSRLICFAVAVFLVSPCIASADAGTPLMWAGVFHLLIGNALIGILEGFIISRVFKVKAIRSILIMALANYFSMIAGFAILSLITTSLESFITLYSIKMFLAVFLIISFMLSVVLEWPFCCWILRKQTDIKRKAWRASLIVQTISYAFIIPLYLLSSGISLLTDCKIDKTLSFVKSGAWVYYIAGDNCSVNKIRVDGSAMEMVTRLDGKSGEAARLFVRPSETRGQWDLGVVDRTPDRVLFEKILLRDFTDTAEPFRHWDGELYEKEPDSWGNVGISDFRLLDGRDWKFSVGFWAAEGLHARSDSEGKNIYVALETPFAQWIIRNVSVLPGNQAVFELGKNQIVVLDLETRKIGLLAFGKGPVVVFNAKQGEK